MNGCRNTLSTGVMLTVLALAAGPAVAELPPWAESFAEEPHGALIHRLAVAQSDAARDGAPLDDALLEQTAHPLQPQRAVVFRSMLRNAARAARSPGHLTLAAWTFAGDGCHNAGYRLLEHRDDLWYGSSYWQGGETWLRVGRDWHHPGDRGPSVRRFTAPRDGRIRITGRGYKAHREGDGAGIAIVHNGQQVWRHELAGDDGQGTDPNLVLDVKRGDAIRFVVDKLGSIACDTTHWDPVVSYADGQTFRASDAFDEKRQGGGNWWYESPAVDAKVAVRPRLLWFDADWGLRTRGVPVENDVVLRHDSAQPLAVLADERDASGVVVFIEPHGAWQLEARQSPGGDISLRVVAQPAEPAEPGQSVALPTVMLGAYLGTPLAGFAQLTQWLADDADGPLADLKRRFDVVGVSEFEYWAMIQQDWQRQDATDPNRPQTFSAAIAEQLEKTNRLLEHLQTAHGPEFLAEQAGRLAHLAAATEADPAARYLQLRMLKRNIALANPLVDFGELLFCKRVPTSYSHLVMQHYGWRAQPGGGLFVLQTPGRSLAARDLLQGKLQTGSVLEPRLSYDAQRIVFSYVDCPDGPLPHGAVSNDQDPSEHFYHIWQVNVDGTGLTQLTNQAYDDLMPCYLPDGGIALMSTRRQGYARCFGGQFSTRWDVYTLHRMDADGSNLRTLSYHDTNEWYPAVSNTGHLLYARWDYIDRDAVTHQNLWASRPDGTNPVAVWGNATPNPHCTFQAQPIPGSQKILFTASAHHSITAGSIAILDPTVAPDGLQAIERITPEVPFPESESRDIHEYYTAPWPLSENFYLVAYSPYPLVWEPGANRKDALGLYLLDRFGNRELIYRDPAIGSTNPCPLRPRPLPPVVAGALADDLPPQGTMLVADVSQGLHGVAPSGIKALRIVQIFPKTTNLANQPPIGLAGEENGRAVLGTVPVESDGSAHFTAPAGVPLLLQALDRDGFAYQTMRSVTYVQPGEHVSCTGCHEHKMTAPVRPSGPLLALRRPPSTIEPGHWGGRPFSYVEVVQPVLDKHCVRCHGGQTTEGNLVLTGELSGAFSRSYLELTTPKHLVPRFAARNQVQMTAPGGEIGALGSRLIQLLVAGHEDVQLTGEELRRLALWIDLNAIFYGVNLPEDQARLLRGDRVEMPDLQ